MAHLGRVTETPTTRTVGLTREQVAAWHNATWTDETTPRTDRPVRFVPSNRYRQTPPVVKRFPGDSFTIRWA